MSASVISMSDFEKSAAELDKKAVTGRLPVSVLVHWSESGNFKNEELIAFDEFERRAFAAAIGHAGRGYLKTKITVNFDDGEQYGCRLDLAARDELGFADHCRQMIAYAETEDGARKYEQIGMISAIEFIRGIAFDFNDPVYADQLKEAAKAEEVAKAAAIAQHEKEESDKKAAFAAEVERIKSAPEFAHLTQYGQYSKTADIAKNIRADLKKHFTGVKFSVTKRYHSSISVKWIDGPTSKQVEEITGKYQCGTFDGMTDCAGWNETPFDIVFGGIDYLHTSREVSDELRTVAVKIIEKNTREMVTGDTNQRISGEWVSDLIWRETNRISQNADGLTYTTQGGKQISVAELLKTEETAEQAEKEEPVEDAKPEQPAALIVEDKAEKPRFKATRTAAGWSVAITVGSITADYGPLSADSYAAAISAAWALHTAPTDPDDDPSGGEKITRAETLGDYSARIDARKERAQIRAVKSASDSDLRYQQAQKIGERFWGGQPILVGHHSEKRARRDHERMDQLMRASIEADKKAAHYESRAEAVGSAGIASDNPLAIELLKNKLQRLENSSQLMKKANALIRKGATVTDLIAIGFSEKDAISTLNRGCFATWAFSNNSAERRRVTSRIEELEKLHSAPPIDMSGDGWAMFELDGRICISFDEIPEEPLRIKIKSNGFKWSRTRRAWVRKVTANAIAAASELIGTITADCAG